MRQLKIITCVPADLRYAVEVNLFLESLKEIGWDDRVDVLIFENSSNNNWKPEWTTVKWLYPKTRFFTYNGSELDRIIPLYIPLLRPFLLKKHFEQFPELEKDAIFYVDSDIIFLKKPEIEKFLQDDMNYLSNTVEPSDYMSHKYFDSKIKDVDPKKLEQYKKRDILEEIAGFCNINRVVIEENCHRIGGAQSLLKNINSEFWEKVFIACINIRIHLQAVNQEFFPGNTSQEREDRGFQSWGADMWALIYTLWSEGKETQTPPELDFVWSSSLKTDISHHSILHNAGITGDSKFRTRELDNDGNKIEVESPAYYKGRPDFASNQSTPFREVAYLNSVINNPISQKYCNALYVEHILKTKNNYNLKY